MKHLFCVELLANGLAITGTPLFGAHIRANPVASASLGMSGMPAMFACLLEGVLQVCNM